MLKQRSYFLLNASVWDGASLDRIIHAPYKIHKRDIVNLFLGYLFVYRGLLYAMAFKVFFGMRYIIAWTKMDKARDMFAGYFI